MYIECTQTRSFFPHGDCVHTCPLERRPRLRFPNNPNKLGRQAQPRVGRWEKEFHGQTLKRKWLQREIHFKKNTKKTRETWKFFMEKKFASVIFHPGTFSSIFKIMVHPFLYGRLGNGDLFFRYYVCVFYSKFAFNHSMYLYVFAKLNVNR